jgi:hypothetical protein
VDCIDFWAGKLFGLRFKFVTGMIFQDVCMEYSAIGLAVLGAAVGLVFRLKVLLPIIGLLLSASIIFSISRGLSFLDAALMVIVAQAILQSGYFVGLLVRLIIATACMRSALWTSNFLKGRRTPKSVGPISALRPRRGRPKARDLS